MDSRRTLGGAVAQVRGKLLMEWFVRTAVRGVSAGAVTAVLLLAASRLFVWPGYTGYAAMAAVLVAVGVFVYECRRTPSRSESVQVLDSFSRDNIILAAETDGIREGPLSVALAEEAAAASGGALALFRKRKGRWTERKPLLVVCSAFAVAAALALFPSSAQQEAQEAEEERGIIEDLADHVNELTDRTEDQKTEKRLVDLSEKIRSADTPEAAVREAVKLQRELSLEERLADRPVISAGQTAGERILTPGEAAAALAELTGDAEEQLARMGRTSGAGEHASVGEQGADSSAKAEGQEGASPSGAGNPGSGSKGNTSGKSGGGESEGDGEKAQDSDGNGMESSNNGTGNGDSGGTGSGSESNGGEGAGSGRGGAGQGSGDGDRNLVSTPQASTEPENPVLDSGPQKEGTSAADSLVPAEKGEVRPYEEVQAEYRDAYVEHAGRLDLPEDLQKVLSDYFVSIDKRE